MTVEFKEIKSNIYPTVTHEGARRLPNPNGSTGVRPQGKLPADWKASHTDNKGSFPV